MRGLPEQIEEGLLAELRFNLEASSRGIIVCSPPAGTVFDFVAVSRGRCFRVQVKGSTPRSHPSRGVPSPRLEYHVKLEGKYGRHNIDVLAVLCKDTGQWHFTTGDEISGRRDARIRHSTTKGPRNSKAPAIQWTDWSIFNH